MAILDNLETTITILLVISILVVVHEWGHFIVARLFGIRVDDFSIGFGKRLVRLGKRGDTEYNIRMLPLGGFVKIAGMEADEAPLLQARDKIRGAKDDDPDAGELPLIAENSADGGAYTAPDGFNAKPLWQRSLVIFAGPVMSFLLGYVIFCLMGCTIGVPAGKYLNRVGMVEPGGAGQKIGLRAGDQITAINGNAVADGDQMVGLIRSHLNRPITLTVVRDGVTTTKTATPIPLTDDNDKVIQDVGVVQPGVLGPAFGLRSGDDIASVGGAEAKTPTQTLGLLQRAAGKRVEIDVMSGLNATPLHGVVPPNIAAQMPQLNLHELGALKFVPMPATERLGFLASVHMGNVQTAAFFLTLASMVKQGQLHKQVGGVIVMYRATQIAVQNGIVEVVSLAAQITLSLAIFNLLPIPILDGGHLLNFFIEWVRGGKKMSEEWQARFMMTGLAIIGTLFIWIMTKNTLQLIFHQLPQ